LVSPTWQFSISLKAAKQFMARNILFDWKKPSTIHQMTPNDFQLCLQVHLGALGDIKDIQKHVMTLFKVI
jgi:hypothetical protein